VSRARALRVREVAAQGVVVDASIAVKWWAPEADSATAVRLIEGDWRLIAPDFMAAEAANTWWDKHRQGEMPRAEVEIAVSRLCALGIEWIPTARIVGAATRVAIELRHSVYDCVYLVTARERGLPLATTDEWLSKTARRMGIAVYPISRGKA
jgi:predicted nucleic acid-binding protein